MCQISGRKRNQHDVYREKGRSLLNGTESLRGSCQEIGWGEILDALRDRNGMACEELL